MRRKQQSALGTLGTLAIGWWITTMAFGQGSIRILAPKPNELVRGEIKAVFERPFPNQGYAIVRLDNEFKEATADLDYLINTRKLKDGPHTLTIDARDDRSRPIGTTSVTFKVVNDTADTTGPGIQLQHWDYSHYMPTKRLLRYRVWAESAGFAVEISPPQAQTGAAGGETPGGAGGPGGAPGMGMPGGGPRGGAMSGSRMGEFRAPYLGSSNPGTSGGPGMMGGSGLSGSGTSGGMAGGGGPGGGPGGGSGGGPGGGGSGGNGPVDASKLDKQMSLLLRSNIKEIKQAILEGKVGDAASIRMLIATAFEHVRSDQQQQGASGAGASGAGGSAAGAGAAGAKPPWGDWTTNTTLENQTFTKMIFPTGDEIRPAGRQWFLNPIGKAPAAALVDLMPRFPTAVVQPGSRWTTSMVFIPELIEISPVEVTTATMQFTSLVDVEGRNCAKLECEVELPHAIARRVAQVIAPLIGSGSGSGSGDSSSGSGGATGGGGSSGGPGVANSGGGARGGRMRGSRLGEPSAELSSYSSNQLGMGGLGASMGMMGSLSGMSSGGASGAIGRARGGLSGGSGGSSAGGGGGGGTGRGGGGGARAGAMGGSGTTSSGGGATGRGHWQPVIESNGQWMEWITDDEQSQESGGQEQQLANITCHVKRVIYFDHQNKSVYRIEDTAKTEFDIIQQQNQQSGEGGLGGLIGMIGGAIGGMLGGEGGEGAKPGGAAAARSGGAEGGASLSLQDVSHTHVVYQVRVVGWQDNSIVPPMIPERPIVDVDGRRFLRTHRPHDYDSVSGERGDPSVAPVDPRNPQERVWSKDAERAARPAPASPAKPSIKSSNGKGKK